MSEEFAEIDTQVPKAGTGFVSSQSRLTRVLILMSALFVFVLQSIVTQDVRTRLSSPDRRYRVSPAPRS